MNQKILVAVDLDHPDRAQRVIAAAESLGDTNTHYHFVTVIPDAGRHMVASFLPKDYDKRVKAEIQERLETLLRNNIKMIQSYEISVRAGTIYEEITELASTWGADITVIGAGRRHKVNLGGSALRVNQHCPTSVFTVR